MFLPIYNIEGTRSFYCRQSDLHHIVKSCVSRPADIGLVVHYPAMGGRTAEHLRQGIRIQVVAAPAPESASGGGTRRRPENIPRLVARREELRDIGRLSFLLFHLQSELII